MQVHDIETAVKAAEAVLTITKADRAFVRGEWLQPNAVALSMGGVPEFDFETWNRSQHFILDDLGYALKQGDLHHWIRSNGLTIDQIEAKLTGLIGEVALRPDDYCSDCQGLTLAVIQGMAVCDVAMAGLALAVAESEGLGQVVDLDGC
jgi:ornithine cyclodeaminase